MAEVVFQFPVRNPVRLGAGVHDVRVPLCHQRRKGGIHASNLADARYVLLTP